MGEINDATNIAALRRQMTVVAARQVVAASNLSQRLRDGRPAVAPRRIDRELLTMTRKRLVERPATSPAVEPDAAHTGSNR